MCAHSRLWWKRVRTVNWSKCSISISPRMNTSSKYIVHTHSCDGNRKSILLSSDFGCSPRYMPIISKIQSRNMTANRIYQTKQVVHSLRHRITAKTDSWIRRQYVDYAFHFVSSSLFFRVCAVHRLFCAPHYRTCVRARGQRNEINGKSVSVALFQSIFRAEKLLFH